MYELFMDIPGYEGLYQVSNLGNVKSLERVVIHRNGKPYTYKERILKPKKDRYGYLEVNLHKDGVIKYYRVHRLVMLTFKANSDNLPEINHINENKTDNRLNNLEWCTREYNLSYGTRKERSTTNMRRKVCKKVLCVETGKIYNSGKEAASHLGISNSHIGSCCKGKRKTTGGYHWKHVE